MVKLSKEEGLRRLNLVSSLVDYRKESGDFVWKERCGDKWFNNKFIGKKSGRENVLGYIEIRHREKSGIVCSVYAHRLVWFVEKGYAPEFEIDHINGIRNDNRIENLRDVTGEINCRNQRLSIRNNSGAAGVSFFKRDGKWRSRINIDGSEKHLGYFDSFDDAVNAAAQARLSNGLTKRHVYGK